MVLQLHPQPCGSESSQNAVRKKSHHISKHAIQAGVMHMAREEEVQRSRNEDSWMQIQQITGARVRRGDEQKCIDGKSHLKTKHELFRAINLKRITKP